MCLCVDRLSVTVAAVFFLCWRVRSVCIFVRSVCAWYLRCMCIAHTSMCVARCVLCRRVCMWTRAAIWVVLSVSIILTHGVPQLSSYPTIAYLVSTYCLQHFSSSTQSLNPLGIVYVKGLACIFSQYRFGCWVLRAAGYGTYRALGSSEEPQKVYQGATPTAATAAAAAAAAAKTPKLL